MEKPDAGAREVFSDSLERHRTIVFKVANTYCRHPDERAASVQEIAAQIRSTV